MNVDSLTKSEISRLLARAADGPVDDPYPQGFMPEPAARAAVLLPFFRKNGSWHLLFIRRSEHDEDQHGGQVAFPGGRADAKDTGPEDTALREAQEEIGLQPGEVEILGRSTPLRTITNYLVTPVVGVVSWPHKLTLNPGEVSRAFSMPLAWLADPANRRSEVRRHPDYQEPFQVTYFTQYDGELLWGASARIMLNLLETFQRADFDKK